MNDEMPQQVTLPVGDQENGVHQSNGDKKRRTPVSQQDLPSCSLKEALRIPQAIYDNYAGSATTPLDVAAALDMTPTGGHFRGLCGAAIAYGLTEGGYNAKDIAPTSLAKRVFEPLEEGDDSAAKREAFLKPKVISDFLTKYDGQRLPTESIAHNVLVSLGVPRERAKDAFDLISSGLKEHGLVRVTGGNTYVSLQTRVLSPGKQLAEVPEREGEDTPSLNPAVTAPSVASVPLANGHGKASNVYVSHGKNKEVVKQIQELLTYGNFKPVVSVEEVSLAKPIPQKVLDEMRSCQAAVIHVGAENAVTDAEGQQHTFLNENVLIEIGAAMALYEGRFVLLVEEGTKLPSNLQGMSEVRYRGGELTYTAAMNLLKTFNEFRSPPAHP